VCQYFALILFRAAATVVAAAAAAGVIDVRLIDDDNSFAS